MSARNGAGWQGGHFPGQQSGRAQTGLPFAQPGEGVALGGGRAAKAGAWAQGTGRILLRSAKQQLANTWLLQRHADSQVLPQTC